MREVDSAHLYCFLVVVVLLCRFSCLFLSYEHLYTFFFLLGCIFDLVYMHLFSHVYCSFVFISRQKR